MNRTNLQHTDLYTEVYEQAIAYLRVNRFRRTTFDGLVNHIFQNKDYWINHPTGMRKALHKLRDVTRRVRDTQQRSARHEVMDAVDHIRRAHRQFEAENLHCSLNELAHRYCPGAIKTIQHHFFTRNKDLDEELLMQLNCNGLICAYTRSKKELVISTLRGKLFVYNPYG